MGASLLPFEITHRRLVAAVATVLTLAAAAAVAVGPIDESSLPQEETVLEAAPADQLAVGTSDEALFERHERIQRGDTLAVLLDRVGLSDDGGLLDFVRRDPVARQLMAPVPGRTLDARLDASGRLLALHYAERPMEFDGQARRLVVKRSADGWVAKVEAAEVLRAVAMRATDVRTTLFAAIDTAGIPDDVAEQVADIFGHQVDFWRQVRRGDQLRVVYETVQLAGSLDAPRAGRVLAAEFVNAGRRYQAMWFERPGGRGEYFGFDGKSLRQGFLRAPLEYTRVSSGFEQERMHPIWNELRAHKGIDYAAPVGTKVRTVGDGTVEYMGVQRGYGNVVVVRHHNEVTSLYAHLNAFAPQLRVGQPVAQGELIGEVGTTGWATGPHLHFEFRVKGEHVDPQSVDFPGARPLDGTERGRYLQALSDVRHRLGLLDAVRVARFE